jgi:hypothetical protein
MNAFLLVNLIFTIAKSDGLGRTKCLAYLAAYALITNVIYLGSFGGNAGFHSLGLRGF